MYIVSEYNSNFITAKVRMVPLKNLLVSKLELTANWNIFGDSSIHSYGFVAYASREDSNTFLFAKSKLPPLNRASEQSIPMLELLGVILAYKYLPTILEAYHNINFQFVNFCVDAKVVLNWLVTKEVKAKYKFLRNRILEVNTFEDGLKENFK